MMNPNGLLFLGSSETIGDMEEHLFEIVDRKWKLYKRKAGETDRTTLQKFSVGKIKPVAEPVSGSEHFPGSPGYDPDMMTAAIHITGKPYVAGIVRGRLQHGLQDNPVEKIIMQDGRSQ